MDESPRSFAETAKGLSKNPLGIIALFIVLVYGFAALVTAIGTALTAAERLPLVYFLVLFPVLVLGVFAWLVSRHTGKLYSPSDFKDEQNFVAVVASLAAATVGRADGTANPKQLDVASIAAVVREVSPQPASEATQSRNRILWVDDRPENNTYERQAFEAIGITFTLAQTTKQALDILGQDSFAAIISDMGRREGPREGYVLLDELRLRGDRTPFFIYAGSNDPAHKRETDRHGGQGCTNNPGELFQLVTSAIRKPVRVDWRMVNDLDARD
jgi:CheY-like chemotaxis protein